ncbi:MAG: LuxR C-terminal-related transcriptional regulator [Psychroserpens sp.]|uniref:helix-turn-helix and ligand-binding sensor domain-containing protein n=1 Tax=Psychroserpens sp. TaxID=2020870 RepID=UPI003002455B
MKFKIFPILICLAFCYFPQAQELPPVQIYSPDQYNADNQNWAVSQCKDDHIFIANNKGLLEFNGGNWKLYPSPKETIMRTVHVVDTLVYTGSYMEFGYWKRDAFGILNYTPLSKELDIPIVDDEQFWDILSLDDYVLFQSLDRIVIYNAEDSSYKIVNSNTSLTKIFKVEETIYFQSIDEGIYKIENGKAELVIVDELVKENIVVNMFDQNGELLVQTQNNGFYLYSDNVLTKWETSSNDLLSQVSVYNSIRLENKGFALGTISNGIIYIEPNGDLKYHINQSSGLGNNTILSLFEDKDHNIWLGLDNGINCINIESPFSIYNDQKGTIGTVYGSLIYNNNLYLGTNQGLFYKSQNSNEDFKFIKGTQGQVWSLVELYDTLFCAHTSGTFVISGDEAKLIDNTFGTWKIKAIANNENLLLQGSYNGLNILARVNGKWIFRNKIEGFDISSRYIETLGLDTVFISHEYKGVLKVKVDPEFSKVLKIDKDLSVAKGPNSSLLKYDDYIFYTYKDGVFRYNESSMAFVKDSLYSEVFKDQTYISGKLVVTDKTNKLWYFSDEGLNYISTGKLSSKPEIETISLPSSIRNSMAGYENIAHIEEHKYLFGSSSGYIIIDLDKLIEKDYEISINSINRHVNNNGIVSIDKTVAGSFENKENNFQFDYSVSEYEKYIEAEYQYQLEGIYNNWSNWSTNSSELFKNLSFGDYTFNVRARIGDDVSSNVASYKFSIAKPWYLANAMVVLYIFGFVAFSFLMHNVYKRYYRKQRESLLDKNKREIELRELESEQQLMQLQNEKLQLDVDNKNRELAISTMSLIKKNEFLNGVKEELKHVNQNNELKSVIKIIDKNLNNTDDWKFFQEAFNNADKDFLKKIKAIHSKLTPNDLRLCAYLRLNLSSKEIAPLLNISSRSVEVKRYRLRKKMDLPHESSLTNYILEI